MMFWAVFLGSLTAVWALLIYVLSRAGAWVGERDELTFKHPTKPGRVNVSGKLSDDLPPGTLNSIRKQAGLRP
jgi:hypothetical protein